MTAFGGYHRCRTFCQREITVDNQHLCSGARQQNCCCWTIADAIVRRTATGDDCHLVDQAPLFIWRHRASCKFVAPMMAG
jgi:hypothetical protein